MLVSDPKHSGPDKMVFYHKEKGKQAFGPQLEAPDIPLSSSAQSLPPSPKKDSAE